VALFPLSTLTAPWICARVKLFTKTLPSPCAQPAHLRNVTRKGLGSKLTWIHCCTATATTEDTEWQLATTKCPISRQLYLNWLLAEWQNVFHFCHTESDCTVEAGTSTLRRSGTHHGHLFPHGFQVAAAHCCVDVTVLAKFLAALKPRVLFMLKLAVTCRRQATVSRYVA